MTFELFKKETELLTKSKETIESGVIQDDVASGLVAELTKAYAKLLKTFQKLVRISDKSEEKLNRLTKELAEKNNQLEEQKQELIEAAKLKEEVDHITRHDLKNPLTNILFTPQLLAMDDNLTDEQKELLRQVEESGLAMLNMINLSLDLFKMERGTYELQAAEVDMAVITRRIFREHGVTAESMDVPLRIVVDGNEADADTVFTVNGEELLLYSMLANLVKNSLEATPENSPVTVSLTGGAEVEVAIHNMGVIPMAIRDSFFEKFATSGKKMGSGLGTYSAKLIAETHGGHIAFETGEESGTTVIVTLP